MTVIDDICSDLSGNWNTGVIIRPSIFNGAEKFNKPLAQMHKGKENTVYVTNYRFYPKYTDPRRNYKDTVYMMDVEIVSNNTGDRDNMFYEVYRIVEATGISGYANREIEYGNMSNDFELFSSSLRFNIIKYNESVGR